MQDGALAADGDGKSILGSTGRDAEHRRSGDGYKTQRRKNMMTILNSPECLSWPLGAECGNTANGKSDGVRGGRHKI